LKGYFLTVAWLILLAGIERLFFDSGLAHFIGWAFAYAFLWIQELSLIFTWDSWMLVGDLFISFVSTLPCYAQFHW